MSAAEHRAVSPEGDSASSSAVAGVESSTTLDLPASSFDGVPEQTLAAMLGVPTVHIFSSAGSALDVAHRLAVSGTPHGTLVLADAQTRGRGRNGKHWASPPGTGLWLALLMRPDRPEVIRVL